IPVDHLFVEPHGVGAVAFMFVSDGHLIPDVRIVLVCFGEVSERLIVMSLLKLGQSHKLVDGALLKRIVSGCDDWPKLVQLRLSASVIVARDEYACAVEHSLH